MPPPPAPRRDPRIQQTLNSLSATFDTSLESARLGCFTFTQSYLEPCVSAISTFTSENCTCCPSNAISNNRRRSQYAFDFYNQDYDESDEVSWGTDELDRLLAGSGSVRGANAQPARNEGMYYNRSGARRKSKRKTKTTTEEDPTIIPNTAPFGFMSWLTPAPVLRYKPSAANLQDHPGGYGGVNGTLREDGESHSEGDGQEAGRRGRSGTVSSEDTYRSRTDLFPSEDEDDAIPLDDEFADTLGLVGRNKKKDKRRLKRSRTMDTVGTSGSGSGGMKTPRSEENEEEEGVYRIASQDSISTHEPAVGLGMLDDEELRLQEEDARREEEEAVEMKRQAASRLALQRGLRGDDGSLRERSSSLASSNRRLLSISSPRSVPSEPVVMQDIALDEEFSPLASAVASPKGSAVFTMARVDHGLRIASPALPSAELVTANESRKRARPILHTAKPTPNPILSFIAANLASALDDVAACESTFHSPTSSTASSPIFSSPPRPLPVKSLSNSTQTPSSKTNSKTSNNKNEKGEKGNLWGRLFSQANITSAQDFFLQQLQQEEVLQDIEGRRSRRGSEAGWEGDDEEATAERWKESMEVFVEREQEV